MARLGMTPEEYDYWVSNISEAFDLIGQEALLFQVNDEVKDLYRDIEKLQHLSHRKIGLIFEDDPKPVLKKMNWLVEGDDLPYVVYICSKDSKQQPLAVRENMVISIPSRLGLESEKLFLVSSVRGNSIDPLYWICKLTPYREKFDMVPHTEKVESTITEKTDTNFAYLKRS